MSSRNLHALASASVLALALTACGDPGSGVASIPPPPSVTPTPTPTPTPTTNPSSAAVIVFPNVTASTSFATVGVESSRGPNNVLTSNGFSVRYDASAGLYSITFPGVPEGGLYYYTGETPNARFWNGGVGESASGNQYASVHVLKPTNPNLPLTYTSYVGYDESGMSPEAFGFVAFGTATPEGAVPITGSATYDALVDGITFDKSAYIRGTATLQFNFGAGQLSGHFDPTYSSFAGLGEQTPLGRYDFANTIYSVGSTTFSGQLSKSGMPQSGSFNGRFTGPSAQELMATWTVPFNDPASSSTSQMFGVWVGKRP